MNAQMIPEMKKILFATDLSESARYAFGYAASLANRYGAGITILYVVEVSRYQDNLIVHVLGDEKWNELRKTNEQRIIETLEGRIKNFCEEVNSELPSCPYITDDIIVKIGSPVEEILRQADMGNFDLIVMGAHGLGILAGAMMGSISRRVLRRCKRPVLVVRLPDK